MKRFVTSALMPGDIVHVRSRSVYGWAIRRAVGSWGTHDALVVFKRGAPQIADAEPPRANTCLLLLYEEALADGRLVDIRVYRPARHLWSASAGALAAAWWLERVEGKVYDYGAIGRLALKALVGDLLPWRAGWEWAWYCTEGVRDAWLKGAGIDLYLKENPTPRTTEKRVEAGWLEDITEIAMFDADRASAGSSPAGRDRVAVFAPWFPGGARA